MNIFLVLPLFLMHMQDALRINEIVSDPSVNSEEDWIEFYNDELVEVNVQGYYFRDDKDDHIQEFENPFLMSAGEYRVVYPNLANANSNNDLFFGLGNSDSVHLYNAAAEKIDSTKWGDGDAPAGYSWAYCNGDFASTSTITKSSVNVCDQTPQTARPVDGVVELSEIKTRNVTGDASDWIEVRNSASQVANLSGWSVSDSTTAYISRYFLPSGTLVQPGEYYVITPGDKVKLGGKDEVHLYDGANNHIETVSWHSDTNTGETLSKCTSAANMVEWQATTMTKMAANNCECTSMSTSIVINEVAASVGGKNGSEWVEFYNSGTVTVDTTKWRFSDGKNNRDPGKQQLLGAVIAPGEYLVVDVGGKVSFSGSSPDGCRLYNACGSLVQNTTWNEYGLPQAGTTWARCSSGEYNVTKTPSKGEANVVTICNKMSNALNPAPSILWISLLWMAILSFVM